MRRERWEVNKKVWQGNLNGKDNFGDIIVGERIMLNWILRKRTVRTWTGFIRLDIISSAKNTLLHGDGWLQ